LVWLWLLFNRQGWWLDMSGEEVSVLFLNQVRRALQHLYDPAELRHSPLQNLLTIDPTADRVAVLRKALQDSIQALKPEEKTPADSNAWRIFDVLSFRFIEQSSQKEVAADMSLSIRQLQRLEITALEVLCDYLVSHYNLKPQKTDLMAEAEPGPGSPFAVAPVSSPAIMVLEQEYDWLKKSSQNEEIEVAQLVESALTTLSPLIQSLKCRVRVDMADSLPKVIGQLTILRQTLINLITAALLTGENGTVTVTATAGLGKMHIQIASKSPTSNDPGSKVQDSEEIISVARQLVDLLGGILKIQSHSNGHSSFEASLILSAVQHVPILVIDDNSDTLRLLERYLSGSRYQFAGGRDPIQIFELIETHHPDIIVLDVMLPGIDGWDLLGRLKSNPSTREIPVIISTILPQESLAMMLGAADFLRKPFTQAQFLEALARQADLQIPGSS
jgi:CheY-like chemotaxis protein